MEIHLVISLSYGRLEAIHAYENMRMAKAKGAELIRELDDRVGWVECTEDLMRSVDGRFEIHLLILPVHTEDSL